MPEKTLPCQTSFAGGKNCRAFLDHVNVWTSCESRTNHVNWQKLGCRENQMCEMFRCWDIHRYVWGDVIVDVDDKTVLWEAVWISRPCPCTDNNRSASIRATWCKVTYQVELGAKQKRDQAMFVETHVWMSTKLYTKLPDCSVFMRVLPPAFLVCDKVMFLIVSVCWRGVRMKPLPMTHRIPLPHGPVQLKDVLFQYSFYQW